MIWNCFDTEERVSDFLDGTMAVDEAAAFKSHRRDCARCEALASQVERLVHTMQRTEAVPIPSQLVARVLDATLGSRQAQSGFGRWFEWANVIWEPRFALGVLTAATSFAIVAHAAGLRPASIGWADLNPANALRFADRQAHLSYGRAEKFVDNLQLVYDIRSQLEPDEAQPEAPPTGNAPPGEPAPQRSPGSKAGPQKQPTPNGQPKAEARPDGGSQRSGKSREGHLFAMLAIPRSTS